MHNWYETEKLDDGIILSSRVRLARNIEKYPFHSKITESQSKELIKEAAAAIKNDRNPLGDQMEYIDLRSLNAIEIQSLIERHIISPFLAKNNKPSGALLKNDASLCIMINEEDHIRIQTIFSGNKIKEALNLADKIDDLMEETVRFAFDEKYGYLTSCPTNCGAGLRASYMLHLPAIAITGQLSNVANVISKFGITIRGTYGEGTEPLGSMLQISNQVTMGQSEEEILENLSNVANQVMETERSMLDKLLLSNRDFILNKIYRAYGILKYAYSVTSKEAMEYLSDLRLGYRTGLLEKPRLAQNIYQIMVNVQPGNLQKNIGIESSSEKRDILRAKYIKKQFIR